MTPNLEQGKKEIVGVKANANREKLLELFDKTQNAFEAWQEALCRKTDVDREENRWSCEYRNAKNGWEKAIKAHGPGDQNEK